MSNQNILSTSHTADSIYRTVNLRSKETLGYSQIRMQSSPLQHQIAGLGSYRVIIIGGGTGGLGGPVAPPLFWPSCSKVKKKYLNKHVVNCLTWWKIVHQIASFEPTFSKKLQLLRWAHPPSNTPLLRASATAGANAPFLTSKNLPPPPTLKIVPPPMVIISFFTT